MRTTLTLETDVATRLKSLMKKRKLTLKEAVNKALRCGLLAVEQEQPEGTFRVAPHDGGFMPGIDPTKLGQVADELETEEYLRIVQSTR
ncbi:MAG: hypothetical protein A2138_25230 [Deltaproteobacteria bacterium RBG_16_71_12]|nr:MAG: hypothetical protein A2138_25230 [Deltaproteobacteria bacterium RBG_16_71_12]